MARRKRNRKTGPNNPQSGIPAVEDPRDALINQAMEMGLRSQQEGNPSQAEQIYNRVLSLDPNNAEAFRLLGIISHEKGEHALAITLIQKSIVIKPNLADSYCHLANAQRSLGYTDEAIVNYRKALSLKPNFPQALNNLGNSFKNTSNIPEAIFYLKKAVSLDRKHARFRCDLGTALRRNNQGEQAVSCFRKALDIKPDYTRAHTKLRQTLQFLGQAEPLEEIISPVRRAIKDVSAEPTPSLANTKVESSLNAMENTVALITLGRAGSMFFHSLFDNHPEIWTTPGIYLKGYFEKLTWETLSGKSGSTGDFKILVENFCDHYEVLFDAQSNKPVFGNPMTKKESLGLTSGLTTMDEEGTHALKLNQESFKDNLLKLLCLFKHVDQKIFFKLIHLAYNETLNLPRQKTTLFYHLHNTELNAIIQYLGLFKRARFIQIIREPVQCLESWLYHRFPAEEQLRNTKEILDKTDSNLLHDKANQGRLEIYQDAADRVGAIFSEYGHFAFNFAPAMMVRLEDVKKRPRELMPLIADWLGVKDHESLYTPTFQGHYYWGPESSLSSRLKGFESTSIDRKAGVLFSERDQFVFKTLLYPARVRFGYQDEDHDNHKKDLDKVEPLLDEPLDFETKLYNSLRGVSAPLKGLRQYQGLHWHLKAQFSAVRKNCGLQANLTNHFELTPKSP